MCLDDRVRGRHQGSADHWEAMRPRSSRPFCSCDGRQVRLADLSAAGRDIIAVGMPVTRHPPRRSVRADFPHTAPTLGVWRQIAYQDTDARYMAWESIAWPKTGSATKAYDGVGSVALGRGTSTARPGPGSSSDSAYSLAHRNNCNAPGPPAEATLRGGEQGHDADASGWL